MLKDRGRVALRPVAAEATTSESEPPLMPDEYRPIRPKHRPICKRCGRGELELIDEWPHPILGIAGITCRTLRCNAVDCRALTTDWRCSRGQAEHAA